MSHPSAPDAAAPLSPTARPQPAVAAEARRFRARVRVAFAAVAVLHLVGLGLLGYAVLGAAAGAVPVGIAALAYVRGLVHAFDFDHLSMIDNSTRKLVAEGRTPASVGLAFSLGHSSVVVATGVLLVAGAGFVRVALDAGSGAARVLGLVGLSVSGLYLLLVSVANLAAFGAAWRLRRALRADPAFVVPPDALVPRGPAARILTAPLARVRHGWHVYVVGVLFSLGFDTASQIGLLMLTAGAALAGAPAVSLLCLPFLFTAAMTLGDTTNGLLMLRLYRRAEHDPGRTVGYNLLVTGVSILSGLLVAALALATLLTEEAGWRSGLLETLAGLDTSHAGYLLAGFFALVGTTAAVLWRRTRSDAALG